MKSYFGLTILRAPRLEKPPTRNSKGIGLSRLAASAPSRRVAAPRSPKQPSSSRRSRSIRCLAVGALLLAGGLAHGQTTSTFDGTTPSGAIPTGTGGFDQYSPFSGALNPVLPLYHVGGRGEVGFDLVWHFQQTWLAAKRHGGANPFVPIAPYPDDYGSQSGALLLGAGAVFSRTGSHFQSCPNSSVSVDSTLARIVFEAPDGSQTELMDRNTNGAVYNIPNPCSQSPGSVDAGRGTDFRSTDGGSLQFLSDTPILDYTSYGYGEADQKVTGTLRFANGITYRIVNSVVQWMRDRNGNLIQFQYAGGKQIHVTWYLYVDVPSQIIDPLGRTITLNYNDGSCGGCTTITYPGYNGASRVIQLVQAHLSSAGMLRGYSAKTPDQLFGSTNQTTAYNFDPVLPSSIQYPDGRRFTFQYNPYGELARVNLPTGGAMEYDYGDGHNGWGSGFEGSAGDNNPVMIYRRLQERREYATGGSGPNFTARTHYTVSYPAGSTADTSVSYDGNGQVLAQTVHTYGGSPLDALALTGTSCNAWNEGLETKTEYGAPGALRTIVNTWSPQSGCQVNERLAAQTTLNDSGQVSKMEFAYDNYGNVQDKTEYDWGPNTPGPKRRKTHTNYVTDTAYTLTANLVSLPSEIQVFDETGGNETQVSETTLNYDEYQYRPLQNAAVPNHDDAAYGTGKKERGNVTTIWRAQDGVHVDIATQFTFDIAGNVVVQNDPKGRQTSYAYNDGTGAHLNQVTNALGHQTTFTYDPSTDQLVTVTDPNGISTTYEYDGVDRLSRVRRAAGTTSESHTRYVYPSLTHTSQYVSQTASTELRADTLLDGMGRLQETDSYEDSSHYIAAQTTYDALGRVQQASNPFRPGDTPVWTTYDYL